VFTRAVIRAIAIAGRLGRDEEDSPTSSQRRKDDPRAIICDFPNVTRAPSAFGWVEPAQTRRSAWQVRGALIDNA